MYPGLTAREHPDKPAVLVHGTGNVLTYGQLEENANRLASVWRAAGLERGDHVALLTSNDPRAFEVYWAAMRSGLYITAVNRHLNADEATYIVNDCGAKAVVVSGKLESLALQVAQRTPDVSWRAAFGGTVAGHLDYDDVLHTGSPELMSDRPRGADMLYSSGTTGRPKGIQPQVPDAQVDEHVDSVVALASSGWRMNDDTIYLSPAPIYHAAPLRTCAAVQALGGTVVLMERFEPEEALAAIESHGVTHSQWVPTMFVRMLKLPSEVRSRYTTTSQQVVLHAAAPCPVEVKQAMIDWWGPILIEYYSSTETNGITLIDSHEWLRHRGSVGRAVLGTARICADDGAELPAGDIGTVYFERDELPFEYHNDPAKTADAQHPRHETWTTTGDIGYLDDEGYLYLTDRKAFTIISGGVNIYPQEIEDCLTLHPAVDDVAVIGVPDDEMGQSVAAFIVPAKDANASPELAENIAEYVRDRIAGYKVPRRVEFVSSLPRTPTGKLQKGKLHVDSSKPAAEDAGSLNA